MSEFTIVVEKSGDFVIEAQDTVYSLAPVVYGGYGPKGDTGPAGPQGPAGETGITTITLTGDVTGSGTTTIPTSIAAAPMNAGYF
jgi:hypothetical protein